jgi:hypothetical protein
MMSVRCPVFDVLTGELNEAYRRLTEAVSPEEAIYAANELARIVRCFSAHRVGCVFCKAQSSMALDMDDAPIRDR